MSWDTEATRRKLLDSATVQFAATGFAGARIDAIARGAGVNKERIYQYFGDKAGLFSAVLESEVEVLLDGVEIDSAGPDALAEVAGILFDRAAHHPHLARLIAWESLELAEPVALEQRAAGCAEMVAKLSAALPGSTRETAAQLLLSLVSIAFADRCLPHLAQLIAPTNSNTSRRDGVVAQARAMAAVV